MSVKIKDIIDWIESWAPASSSYSYDNVGLIIGNSTQEIERVLLTLDVTPLVIDEAVKKNSQLIIAHHPPIFQGIRRISPDEPTGYIISQALKHDIAILAAHTNLDLAPEGVSYTLAQNLGLYNIQPIDHENHFVEKLKIRADSGTIKQLYKKINMMYECHFLTDVDHNHKNMILEITCESTFIKQCLKTIHSKLPSKAFHISQVKSLTPSKRYGIGAIGTLTKPLMNIDSFLKHVNLRLKPSVLNYTKLDKEINRVAVCGGSGSSLIHKAKRQGAQVYITSDLKYHDFFESTPSFALIDAGHYATEIVILPVVQKKLISIFSTKLARIEITGINTSPVHVFQT